MELVDCAFPLLAGLDLHDDPNDAFDGVNVALLVGSRPAHEGHGARRAAVEATARSSPSRARRSTTSAADDVKVLVVGNPANTNCLIAMNNAPDIPRERFTAMTRLDHNRAIAQLANKLEVPVTDVTQMASGATTRRRMYPDLFHAKVGGAARGRGRRRPGWIEDDFLPTRRQARRGDHRGPRRVLGGVGGERRDRPRPRLGARHADGDWVSMGVASDGSYGIARGPDLRLPVHVRRRASGEIVAGPRARRLLARQDRRLGRGAGRASATRSPSRG